MTVQSTKFDSFDTIIMTYIVFKSQRFEKDTTSPIIRFINQMSLLMLKVVYCYLTVVKEDKLT